MEDELDDKIIYQTYVSHMKIMSRVAWGSIPLNVSPLAVLSYLYRMIRIYILKPEVLIFGMIVLVLVMYLHTIDLWSRNLIGRLQYTLHRPSKESSLFNVGGDAERAHWEDKNGPITAYAIQGRRPKMEDRFVINENVDNTDISFFAVFDGHGGEFAANYAREKLVKNIYRKIVEVKNLSEGKPVPINVLCDDIDQEKDGKIESLLNKRRKSFKKTTSTTDECIKGSKKEVTDEELLNKLESFRPVTRETKNSGKNPEIKSQPASNYINNNSIDFGKLLTNEILAADHSLVEEAKKNFDVAGTTALIAILDDSKLIVANVGDSRGVMCDNRGNAIPISFDHKPQQMRERKRIKEAGGFVIFNGVWRVAGILATSRAMGDYPLKDKNFVIAEPDILTFELKDHKPQFVILASDGLWDTFTNEEAVAFIRGRLHEPDYGAKSLTLQAYYKGSLDNITVVIINFKENAFSYQKIKKGQ